MPTAFIRDDHMYVAEDTRTARTVRALLPLAGERSIMVVILITAFSLLFPPIVAVRHLPRLTFDNFMGTAVIAAIAEFSVLYMFYSFLKFIEQTQFTKYELDLDFSDKYIEVFDKVNDRSPNKQAIIEMVKIKDAYGEEFLDLCMLMTEEVNLGEDRARQFLSEYLERMSLKD